MLHMKGAGTNPKNRNNVLDPPFPNLRGGWALISNVVKSFNLEEEYTSTFFKILNGGCSSQRHND